MKNRNTKPSIRIFAFIFTFVMLFTTVLPVFAVTITTDKEQLTGADIVSEDESKREKFSKHFLTGDGTYFAVAYSEQVNYLDDDGEWKEVDNTLSTNILTGEKSTRNDKFKVKFANKANKDKLVSIQTDEFKVSWGLSVSEDGSTYSALNKVKGTENEKLKAKDIKTTQDAQSLGKAVSGIIYEDAYGDYLDVRYTITHQKVKEDLILSEKSDFKSYKVTYNINNIKGAYAELDGGEVTFYNGDDEPLFKAGLPVMYDGAGETSSDIQVSIIPGKKTVEVIYTPSSEWLNDDNRVYPVTVDPEVVSSQNTDNIMDTTFYYNGSATNYYAVNPRLTMGMDNFNFIKIINVPNISNEYTVLGADIVLYGDTLIKYTSNNTVYTYIYNTEEYWNEYMFKSNESDFIYDPNIEYFEYYVNMPERGTTVYIAKPIEIISDSLYRLSLDISEIYNDNGGYNEYFNNYYGFEIAMDASHEFRALSSEYQENPSYRPCIITRYSVTVPEYSIIDTSQVYKIKNNGNNYYLSTNSPNNNLYTIPEEAGFYKGFKFIYNISENCYNIQSSKYTENYIAYIKEDPEPNRYTVTLNSIYYTSPNNILSWKLYTNTDGTYSIISNDNSNYALSADYSIVFAENYSSSNIYQKWSIEIDYDDPMYYDELRTILKQSEDIYYQTGSKIKLKFGFPISGLYTSNNEIAEVNEHNILTLKKPGTVTLKDSTGNYIYTVYSLIKDGTYFIKNKEHSTYVQIDDNEETNTDGAKLELWDFDGNEYQQWKLEYVINGYFKIISKESALVITVKEGDENKKDNALIQSEYDDPARQLWRITPTASGGYKIKAKSSEGLSDDLVMCAGANFIIDQGLNVEQREYNGENNSFKDEWYLINTNLKYWNSIGDKIACWKTDPKIYVQIDENLNSTFFNNKINEAVSIWNNALDINIQFTESIYDSDINLHVTTKQNYIDMYRHLNEDIGKDINTADGRTYMSATENLGLYYNSVLKGIGEMQTAKVGIFWHDETSPDIALYVILHELGHALGYYDHSTEPNDVMYEKTGSRTVLSQTEINHLKQIYDRRDQL